MSWSTNLWFTVRKHWLLLAKCSITVQSCRKDKGTHTQKRTHKMKGKQLNRERNITDGLLGCHSTDLTSIHGELSSEKLSVLMQNIRVGVQISEQIISEKRPKSLLQKRAEWDQIQWFTRFISQASTHCLHTESRRTLRWVTECFQQMEQVQLTFSNDLDDRESWETVLHTESGIRFEMLVDTIMLVLCPYQMFQLKMKRPECTFIFSNNSCSRMTMTKAQSVCWPHCLVFLLLL